MPHSVARRRVPAACVGVVLAAAGVALAQTAPTPAAPRRDPLDATQPVPPLVHRSAITTHRRHAEQPVGSWREANDTVTRIGGWRAYAREARPTEAPASAPSAASAPAKAAPTAPGGHAGHAGRGQP